MRVYGYGGATLHRKRMRRLGLRFGVDTMLYDIHTSVTTKSFLVGDDTERIMTNRDTFRDQYEVELLRINFKFEIHNVQGRRENLPPLFSNRIKATLLQPINSTLKTQIQHNSSSFRKKQRNGGCSKHIVRKYRGKLTFGIGCGIILFGGG